MKSIKNILYLLSNSEKKKYFILMFFLVISTFLEVFSIAIILPVFELVFLNKLPHLLEFIIIKKDFLNENITKILILFLTLIIYVIKNFFSIFYNYYTLKFFYSFNYRLTNDLIRKYLTINYDFYLTDHSKNIFTNIFIHTSNCKAWLVSSQIFLTEIFFIFLLVLFLAYINFVLK